MPDRAAGWARRQMAEAAPSTNDFFTRSSVERSPVEHSPDERRLYDQLYEANHACRVVEERNKQLQEQVWRLSQDLSKARVVRIISEKEVRKWQEQVEQLSMDLSKACCLEFPQKD